MTTRFSHALGAVAIAAALFGACSSDNPVNGADTVNGSDTAAQPGATDPAAPADLRPMLLVLDDGAEDPLVREQRGRLQAAATAAVVDDLCATIPDLGAIEAAIGVPVKNPLGIGEPGGLQSCTLQRATDDFAGISFTLFPGGTIAGQIEYAKTTFQIDIVPLEGADGFYAGEGESVYHEANGNLYQTQSRCIAQPVAGVARPLSGRGAVGEPLRIAR